jgi:cytochrome P450
MTLPTTQPTAQADVEGLTADELLGKLLGAAHIPADPYPIYNQLRRVAPNHLSALGVRFISSYSQTAAMLRSTSFTQTFGFDLGTADQGVSNAFLQVVADMIIFKNPPEHPRLRRLVTPAFLPRALVEWRSQVEELVAARLDQFIQNGGGDLEGEYAAPIPAIVLARLLGMPYEDHQLFENVTLAFEAIVKPIITEEALSTAHHATLEFHTYIRDLVEDHRSTGQQDLLGMLIAAEDQGDRLTESELVSLVFNLVLAGSDTTASLISSGVLHLLNNPDELNKLRTRPELIGNTVDEILRFEPPVQNSFMRVATKDTDIEGVTIGAGERVVAFIAAANRDPDIFPEPDRFRVDRARAKDHLAFGYGAHLCLGRSIGKLQASIALSRLLERAPQLRLASGDVRWRETAVTRRLQELPVLV